MSRLHYIAKRQTVVDRLVTNSAPGLRGSRASKLSAYQADADSTGWKIGDIIGRHEMRQRLGSDDMTGHLRAVKILRALGKRLAGNVYERIR